MVRKFPPFRSERKKRTTSEGSLQFPNGFSGKLLFHLTFNRNFRIFLLNGKHPESCVFTLHPRVFQHFLRLGSFSVGVVDQRGKFCIRVCWKFENKYMLFAGWEVRMVKNCDWGLENVARGRRPRATFSSPRSQFFTIRTDPKPTKKKLKLK